MRSPDARGVAITRYLLSPAGVLPGALRENAGVEQRNSNEPRPDASRPDPTRPDGRCPRIYLAGPDVFFPDARRIFDTLKAQCERLGLEGVEPSDGGIGAGFHGSDDEMAQRIYDGNMALIRGADGVIANLVNFRGHEPDSGTVFEVGVAIALGKPVVAYGVAEGTYADRISAVVACSKDAAGVLREVACGVMVEGLGQRLNLMLTRSAAMEATAQAALIRMNGLLRVQAKARCAGDSE